MYTTIYDLNGNILTDGVGSQVSSDATINTARRIARDRRISVVVEDRGARECYRVFPSGRLSVGPPKGWKPCWEQQEEE